MLKISKSNHKKSHYSSLERETRVWKKIVRFCNESGYKFVDDSFPPCDKSLYIDFKNKSDRPVVKWLRPEEIRTHPSDKHLDWCVLNQPQLNDIKQGLLGNCWLLSGLVVILEQLELLQRILVSTDFSTHGCYLIRLCHNGEWKLVIVDDLFPCNSHSRLIYSQAVRKQLWVPLIEKAMAKLNGSYESLVAGQTVEGLSALTGYPCESIRLEDTTNTPFELDLEMIWMRLLSMKEAGYVLAASCGRANIEDDKVFTDRGLLPRHAYSILNIVEVLGNQLIQLRNPWGRYAWTGDWCASSSKWSQDIKKALDDIMRYSSKQTKAKSLPKQSTTTTKLTDSSSSSSSPSSNQDEGVFWMSFADFVQYFSSIDICKTRLDWFENRQSGVFATQAMRKLQAFHLIIFDTCQLDIELFHKTTRNRRENSHLDLCFVVLEYRTRRFVMSSKRSIKKFIQAEHMFEPGEYLIVPMSFNFWDNKGDSKIQKNNSDDPNERSDCETNDSDMFMYNLVVHCAKPFMLESEFFSINLLAQAVIEVCTHNGQQSHSGMEGVCIYTLAKGYSGLIVAAENLNERAYFHVELDCVQSSNVISTRQQALFTIDSVPPRTRQVLILLSQREPSLSYSVQYSIKYRLSTNPYLNTWPGNEGIFCKHQPDIEYGLHSSQSVLHE